MTTDIFESRMKLEKSLDIIKGMAHAEQYYSTRKNKWDRSNNYKNAKDSRIANSPVNVIDTLDEETTLQGYERHEICKWMYKVIDYFSLERETMVVAMSHIDRYMVLKDRRIQDLETTSILLITVSSLYLATKLNEPKDKVSLLQFSVLSQGKFSESMIASMEYELLVTLNWFVNPPTPQSFSHQLLNMLPTIKNCHLLKIIEVSNYIIELSIFEMNLAMENASTIACAANFIALKCSRRSIITQQKVDEYKEIVKKMKVINIEKVESVGNCLVESLNLNKRTLLNIQKQIDPEGTMYHT